MQIRTKVTKKVSTTVLNPEREAKQKPKTTQSHSTPLHIKLLLLQNSTLICVNFILCTQLITVHALVM